VTIAVVIPCFNQGRWIERTIESVLAQRTPPDDVIVVDDGSTDNTPERIAIFAGQVSQIRQERQGACSARNAGLARVSARYIFFLDGDDYIEGDFLGGAQRALEHENADVAFSPVFMEHESGRRDRVFHYSRCPTPKQVFAGWLDRYSQPPCSIVWRTDFVRDIGGWDVRVLKNQDGEFCMRAMLSHPKICSFEDGWGVYNAHGFPSVSKLADAEALRSEYQAMRALVDQTRQAGRASAWPVAGFARKFYIIARGAFQIGDRELGREALAAAETVGSGRRHHGSFTHRLFASALGLERKTDVARMIRSYFRSPS
jgi:glycosyltransferase involved in cell wall biosynthesis